MATVTPKQLAGCQRRSIRAMRAKLLEMALEWADLDEYNANLLEEAARRVCRGSDCGRRIMTVIETLAGWLHDLLLWLMPPEDE